MSIAWLPTDVTLHNDGLTLAASVMGPAEAQPILFLHGLAEARDTWQEIAYRLSDRYRVWTLDLRGHGHSGRASDYALTGYVSDARTALAAIGRPAIVVGHSLGGVTAGALAQDPSNGLIGAFLEDPPWYFGDAAEFQRSWAPKGLALARNIHARMVTDCPSLDDWVTFVSNRPAPDGGVASDHLGPRHVLSIASAMQRMDNAAWRPSLSTVIYATLDPDRPLLCPVKVIQADPRRGAAFLDGHEQRFVAANPDAEIVRYDGASHMIHRLTRFADRYFGDLQAFLEYPSYTSRL